MALDHIGARSLLRHLGGWRAAQGSRPAYQQLSDALRLLILDGRLPLRTRLPGERDLAQALGVSRTTVASAFETLRGEGYLRSRQGSGSRTSLPTPPGEWPGAIAPATEDGAIDLATASLPAGSAVHQAYAAAIAALPIHLPGHGYQGGGLLELRTAIADRYVRRGLPTSASQILVTSGAVHGLSILLRLFAGPGSGVVIDHPTYPHAIDAIQRAGCRLLAAPLPDDSWDVDGLTGLLSDQAPGLAYLIPDFHNPTGRWMTPDARAAVAQAARRSGSALVFDETMRDLNLEGEDPLTYEGDDVPSAIRLGSTGKSFWGGLRIGWIRGEADVISALAEVRRSIDLGTPALEQLAAAYLLTTEAGLAERRVLLRERRAALMTLVARHLPTWKVNTPPGGMSLWAELPLPVSSALAAASLRLDVRLAAGPRFGLGGAFERYVRLPYTQPTEVLAEAVRRIAVAEATLGGSRRGRGAIPADEAPVF